MYTMEIKIQIKFNRDRSGIYLEPKGSHETDPFVAQDRKKNDVSFQPIPPTELPNVPCPPRPEPHTSDYYR